MIVTPSKLEEFLYCPRQFYYHEQGIKIDSDLLKQGRLFHKNNDNIFLHSKIINGILDRIEGDAIVEIKRTRSFKLHSSHKLQILAYLYLAHENGFKIKRGIVRYSNGREFTIFYNKAEKRYMEKVINKMQSINKVPERLENKSKCINCSLKDFCWM